MNPKPRIAIVVSHPIQHFCPQYASFAGLEIADIKVFFASALGYKKYHDPGFGQQISWENLYLDEFEHVFLNNGAVIQPSKNIDAAELEPALDLYAPNLLIVYGYYQKLQRRAYTWARKHHVPLAYISDSERKQKRKIFREIIKYPLLFKYFSGIRFFLTVGNANESFYAFYGVPSKKLIRMHFSIDRRIYIKAYENKSALRALTRNKFDIGADEIVLSVVGKLVHWKSQQDIIKAMQALEGSGIVYHLLIIGSGPMLEECRQTAAALVKNKVHFAGFVKPDELPGYYAATDIYIHPAAMEPHSLSISEAIYMGCPVIISDRCGSYGPTDDVQESKNGFVYAFGNIGELENKIKWISTHPTERAAFAAYSHNIAVRFQEQSHHQVLIELLKHLN